MELINLKGVSRPVECEVIKNTAQIEAILESGKAGTVAHDNGAINIWKDNDGLIRCDAMRLRVSFASGRYSDIAHVNDWYKMHIKQIK